MSIDLDKATTRNLLDGLRSFVTTFDSQLDAARQNDALAITESREHLPHAVCFGDLLPRLQTYAFVTLLTMTVEARLTVFCKALQDDHGLPKGLEDFAGDFLDQVQGYLHEYVQAEPPSGLWNWMRDLFLLRRFLVSGTGNVGMLSPRERHDLALVTKRRPDLCIVTDTLLFNRAAHPSLRPDHVLDIGTEFCYEAVTAAQGLFGYLYQHRDLGGL